MSADSISPRGVLATLGTGLAAAAGLADAQSGSLVEQDVAAALRVAGRARVLEQGRMVAEGAPDALLARAEIRRACLGVA